MCFSATASLIAGGSLSTAGVAVLTQATAKKMLPFAAVPLLFGIQQTIEGVVWLSFGSPQLNELTTFAYSMFSHVLWPIFVPLAVLLLEPDPVRRRILYVFLALGTAVGTYLLYSVLQDGITSRVLDGSISYDSPHLYTPAVLTLYVLATCLSSVVSSHFFIRMFGVVMFTAFIVTGLMFSETFISVWCFFAALLSALVFWFIRDHRAAEGRTGWWCERPRTSVVRTEPTA
jgi:hypothetical protein